MLKTIGLSIASASRVNGNEIIDGGGAGAESGRSVIKQKVDSIVCNHLVYPKHKEDVHSSLKPQRAGLIAEKAPTKIPVKYANFAFFLNLAFKLSKYIGINNHAVELVNDYPSHL